MEEKVYVKIDDIYYDAGTEADLINKMNAEGIEDFETTDEIAEGDLVYVGQGWEGIPIKIVGDGFILDTFDINMLKKEDIERLIRVGLIV